MCTAIGTMPTLPPAPTTPPCSAPLPAAPAPPTGPFPATSGSGPGMPQDPVELLAATFDASIVQLAPGDPRRTQLEALRPRLDALRAEAQRTGSFDPVAIAAFSLEMKIALADAARRPALEAVRPFIAQMQADAMRTGSFDPLRLLEANLLVLKAEHPEVDTRAFEQRLAQAKATSEQTGSFNPLELHQLSTELSALGGGVLA